MSLKLDGTGKITGIDQGLSVVGVTTLHNELSVSGDVVVGGGLTVTGVLTYEDVTNVDSIGIITARSGIVGDLTGNVTGDITGNIAGTSTIAGISSSISDTAVDVFIYDTSKDSDGGAWRKRTQHTSWYNETLNTATRGSRREFPAVAVIVVTAATTRKLYIYDGDDPDLPMWMVIDTTDGQWPQTEFSSLYALNGIIALGSSSDTQPLYETRNRLDLYYFVSDKIESSGAGTGGNYYGTVEGLVNRRTHATNRGTTRGNSVYDLVNVRVNDVAMTVLPNAPIDDITGLLVPTIAVATDGGVSVIKDDGTVVDIRRTSDDDVHFVDFDGDRVIMFMELGAIYVATILSADQSGNPNPAWSVYGSFGGNTSGTDHPAIQAYGPGLDLVSMKDHTFATAGYNLSDNRYKGLSILSENVNSSGNGMVAWAHTDFNTGWMHGDIKGAFLSDTDTTNATDSNVVNNGTFDSNTNGWFGDSGASVSWDSGGFASVGNGGGDNTYAIAQSGILVSGAKYRVTGRVQPSMSGSYTFRVRAGGSSVQWSITSGLTNGAWSNFDTGLITADGTVLEIGSNGGTITNFYLDDVYVWKLEEEDRSVSNTGLEVHGTITKSAVATGADLVAYSGFSASNYLQQPYNSDLDFGTGDFSIMFWYKATAGDYTPQCFLHRGDGGVGTWGSGKIIQIEFNSTNLAAFLAESAFSSYDTVAIPGATAASGQWQHYTLIRRGNFVGAYLDGELKDSTLSSRNLNNTSARTWIGERPNNSRPLDTTSLALLRISKSAPSDEQIKKIFNDEKHLFQENSKATLYGSSDAVTALGYDEVTEQLHVGTSSGRSDFQGLRRINNTTTAVTTAISAHDEFIAEQ